MDITALAAALTGAIGGNDEEQQVTSWLDLDYPPLNEILSGDPDKGLPQGRIVEIFGPSSSGKTLLATLAMLSAQKAGGVAMFNDHENTFQMPFAQRLGLSDKFPQWVYRRPRTWEESNTNALKACEAIRKSNAIDKSAPIVVVFDSVAAMIPKSVFEKGIEEYTMNDTTALARVTSTTLKAVNQYVGDFNATFIYLNQIRTKPGVVYGDPTTTPGGAAMEFYASIRLSLGKKMEKNTDKEVTGQLIGITTKKNKLTRPFQEVDLRLSFTDDGMSQFDFIGGMLDALVEKGKLVSSGGRITWLDGKSYFKKQLVATLSADPATYPALKALYKKS